MMRTCPICWFDPDQWFPLPTRPSYVASALAGAIRSPEERLERHLRTHTPQEWIKALETQSAASKHMPGPEEIADMVMKDILGIVNDMDGEVHDEQREMSVYGDCLEFGHRLRSLILTGVAD